MVHNGIEYGIMAAYAEGLNIIKHADAGRRQRERDAETAPLESPELYQYEIDTTEVAEVWTSAAAIDVGVPAPVLTAALYSRNLDLFADQVLSAMRKGFGGHDEKTA